MQLKNLKLTLTNVTGTANAKTLPVNATSVIHTRDANGSWSEDISGYALECSAYRGDTLKVKLPLDVKEHIDELNKLLENDMLVEVSFVGLKLIPYAMKSQNGNILSGVSAKATDFVIAKSTKDVFEDFDIEE